MENNGIAKSEDGNSNTSWIGMLTYLITLVAIVYGLFMIQTKDSKVRNKSQTDSTALVDKNQQVEKTKEVEESNTQNKKKKKITLKKNTKTVFQQKNKTKKASSHERYVRRFAGHTGNILAMSVSPNGEWMATAGEDGQLRMTKVSKENNVYLMTNIENYDRIVTLSWCSDNRTITCGFRKATDVAFYRMRKKQQLSSDNKNNNNNNNTFPFEVAELIKRRFSISTKIEEMSECIVDPSSDDFCLLLTRGRGDKTTVAWDGKEGSVVSNVKTGNGAIRLSQDGRFLCGRGEGSSSEVKIFEVQRKKPKGGIEPVFDKLPSKHAMTLIANVKIADIAFSDNKADKAVTCGIDGILQVWNLNVEYKFNENPKLLCFTTLPKKAVDIAFGANGTRIAVATDDADLHVFTYSSSPNPSLKEDFVIPNIHPEGVAAIQFCPSGKAVYTRGRASKEVHAWSVE